MAVTFNWHRLFPTEENAIAALTIFCLCCVVCMSYLSIMIYLFFCYIPSRKLLKTQSTSYYNQSTQNGSHISNMSTNSIDQYSPNNIRLSVTSHSATQKNENDTDNDLRRISITSPPDNNDNDSNDNNDNNIQMIAWNSNNSNENSNKNHLNIPASIAMDTKKDIAIESEPPVPISIDTNTCTANHSNSNLINNNVSHQRLSIDKGHKVVHSRTSSVDYSITNGVHVINKYLNIIEEDRRCIILSLPTRNFRILLFLAIICSSIFIFTTTIITLIILFTDFTISCSFRVSITLFLVIQRILLYSFFILRLSFSFKESSYKISNYKLIICAVLMCFTSLTPAISAQFIAIYSYCEYHPLYYCFVAAVIQDIFWALFTLTWYIIKLIKLENSINALKDDNNNNNNKQIINNPKEKTLKTKTITYSIASPTSTIHEEKEDNDYTDNSIKAPPTRYKRQRSKSADTLPKIKPKTRHKRKLSISERVRTSITSLHRRTNSKLLSALQKNMKIKRLVRKLLILTITAISSTIIVGGLFGWISIWAGLSLDLIVNNLCMLLSFRCADNIFKKLYPCCSYGI